MNRRWSLVLTLALALTACGPSEPAVQLDWEMDRTLTYDFAQRDAWPGMVLQIDARAHLTCFEHAQEGRMAHKTVLENVRFISPPIMGAVADTATPEPEEGDKHDTEAMLRPLLGIETRLVLDRRGFPGNVTESGDIVMPIRAWVGKGAPQRAPLAQTIQKVVDPAILFATSFEPAAIVMPPKSQRGAASGAKWRTPKPPMKSMAGASLTPFDVEMTRPSPGRAVIVGVAKLVPDGGMVSAQGGVAGGTMKVTVEVDVERGVFVAIDLDSETEMLHPKDPSKSVIVKQHRSVKLVE